MARVAPKPEVAGYCAAQWPDFTPPLTRGRPVRFFEMREVSGTFHLRKYALDTDELGASLPRRSRSIFEAFEDMDKE